MAKDGEWYKAVCMAQAKRIKQLEAELRNIEYKLKERKVNKLCPDQKM